MMRKTYLGVSIASSISTIYGFLIFYINLISLLTLFFLLISISLYFLYTFIATFYPVTLCSPILTIAYAPYPIVFPIIYSSTLVFVL